MKKKEIKGLSAFALLEGLDDDLILSASLPEAAPVAPPTVGEKLSAFFARMGKGGMAAAITGIVVALAVLLGVALAWPWGSWGVIEPPDTDPSHGIHGSLPDTNNGIIAPPLTQSPEQEKGKVAVVSDGITVYPKGYCVWESGQQRNERGDLVGFNTDGRGAVSMLDRIWDMLPVLRTSGNDFDVAIPDNMTLRSVRVFEMVDIQTKTFEELALLSDEMEDYRDRPWEFLSTLRGFYTVVLEVYHETIYSEDEYTKGVDEYAFKLEVDPNLDITYPVRLLVDGKTYYLQGYDGINSGYALAGMTASIPTAVMTRETEWDVYLSPQGTLQSVTAYDGIWLMMIEPDLEPLVSLSAWGEGDYYFVFTVTFSFEGESLIQEYPFHIKVVEDTEQETEEETYPNDVGETPEPPRVTVVTGFGSLHFGNTSHSSEYHEGYMLWTEQWYDGGMVSGDGFGAEGQLTEIFAQLPWINHDMSETPTVRIVESNDTLTRVSVYDKLAQPIADGADTAVLSTLEEGVYAVILTVVTQGDYIEEADAYERTCTEYAFILKMVEVQAGIPDVPETTPG